jgi:hypothetical protein
MPTLDKSTIRFYDDAGIRRRRTFIYTGPASYVTGGDSFVPADVSLGVIEVAPGGVATDGTTVRLLAYDYTNQKYQWFVPNTNVEVANGVNLSTFLIRLEIIGR